ncbi:prolipoprotein diacylglyceryl transferase [Chloroflexota bacterium]
MTIDIDPIIFEIGSQEVGWHGVMMVIGIVVATLVAGRMAAKEGIASDAVYTAAFWIVLFGLIGARITHVIDEFGDYSDNPAQILAIWEGGLGWYGGYIGGMVGGLVYTKLSRIPFGRLADVVSIAGILGLAIGRIGCTINGDSYGTPTSLPWGFTYTQSPYTTPFDAGHPAPVYEIIWILVIISVLWKLRGRLSPPGSLFLVMVALYSFGRFFISWVRAEPAVLGSLHQAHLFSIILFVGSLAFLAYRKVHLVKPEDKPEALGEGTVEIEEEQQSP